MSKSCLRIRPNQRVPVVCVAENECFQLRAAAYLPPSCVFEFSTHIGQGAKDCSDDDVCEAGSKNEQYRREISTMDKQRPTEATLRTYVFTRQTFLPQCSSYIPADSICSWLIAYRKLWLIRRPQVVPVAIDQCSRRASQASRAIERQSRRP